MAGLGLGVELRAIAHTGMRVTLAVTASLIVARHHELRAYLRGRSQRPIVSDQRLECQELRLTPAFSFEPPLQTHGRLNSPPRIEATACNHCSPRSVSPSSSPLPS